MRSIEKLGLIRRYVIVSLEKTPQSIRIECTNGLRKRKREREKIYEILKNPYQESQHAGVPKRDHEKQQDLSGPSEMMSNP